MTSSCKLTYFPNCCLEVQLSRVTAKLHHHPAFYQLLMTIKIKTSLLTKDATLLCPCLSHKLLQPHKYVFSYTRFFFFSWFSFQLDQWVDLICRMSGKHQHKGGERNMQPGWEGHFFWCQHSSQSASSSPESTPAIYQHDCCKEGLVACKLTAVIMPSKTVRPNYSTA